MPRELGIPVTVLFALLVMGQARAAEKPRAAAPQVHHTPQDSRYFLRRAMPRGSAES